MRRTNIGTPRKIPFRLWVKGLALLGIVMLAAFNSYVNREIRPVLMELAEYEARALTTRLVHTAVQEAMQENPQLCDSLYVVTQDSMQLDAVKANAVRNELTVAVERTMENAPTQEYHIPFGSLTGNSLLSGKGPGWTVELKPEGYVQAQWRETTESLSINVTRCSVQLDISVIVNMVLDGRTETMTVVDGVPLASVLLRGDVPTAYAVGTD